MPETKPDLNYVCPHCGQKAIAGNHFCEKTTAPPRTKAAKTSRNGQTKQVVAVAAVGLGVLVLWRFVGPASLVLASLGLLGFLLWGGRKKK